MLLLDTYGPFLFQVGLAFVLAVARAAPQTYNAQFVSPPLQPEVRIISQKFDQDPYGNYEYAYEQDNGQKVSKCAIAGGLPATAVKEHPD